MLYILVVTVTKFEACRDGPKIACDGILPTLKTFQDIYTYVTNSVVGFPSSQS